MAKTAINNVRMSVANAPDAVRPEILRDGTVKYWCEALKIKGVVGIGEGTHPDADRFVVIPRTLTHPLRIGWRAGWVQLCCQEEVWAIYRGETPGDGTIRAKWPSYEAIDTASPDNSEVLVSFKEPLYQGMNSDRPTANLEFMDVPIQTFETTMTNTVTRKTNTLAVAVARFSFILVLAARDPEDNLYLLKWVPWWVRWESTFKLTGTDLNKTLTEQRVDRRTQGGTGNPQYGIPQKLINLIKLGSRQSANVLAGTPDVKCYPNWKDLAHIRPIPALPAKPKKPAAQLAPSGLSKKSSFFK
jgi:hypothetical protein